MAGDEPKDDGGDAVPLPLPKITVPVNPEPKHTCSDGDTLSCPACS